MLPMFKYYTKKVEVDAHSCRVDEWFRGSDPCNTVGVIRSPLRHLLAPPRQLVRASSRKHLVIGQLLRFGHENEDVHMVGHHAVGEKFDPGKRRDPFQQLDEPRTLLRIQEEGPMRYPTDQMINTIWQVLAKFSHAA